MAHPPLLDPVSDALFLDFDGTLVGFEDDPAAVRIEPAALDVLIELQARLSGALAIVSGRRIADLDRFLAPLRFAAAGVHGLEQRTAPGAMVLNLSDAEVLDDLRNVLRAAVVLQPGLDLEDKGTALVLHSRRHPELGPLAVKIVVDAVQRSGDFVVMQGKDIAEVHVAGMDKGRAVSALCQTSVFQGRRPVYLGDDVTDEFAFRAVREVGGLSIKIGDGASDADYRIESISGVYDWLRSSI